EKNVQEAIRKAQERAVRDQRRALEQALRAQQRGFQQRGIVVPINPNGGFGQITNPEESRLGAALEEPDATLVAQLGLPRGQGMVIRQVQSSAAARAGLQAHDILLEINGKPVPNDENEFATLLESIKTDTPVDVVVLRKGKKETIKGLSLPE